MYVAFVGNVHHCTGGFWPLPVYATNFHDVIKQYPKVFIPDDIFYANRRFERWDKLSFKYLDDGRILDIRLIYQNSTIVSEVDGLYLPCLIADIKIIKPSIPPGFEKLLSSSDPIPSDKEKKIKCFDQIPSFIPPGFEDMTIREISKKYIHPRPVRLKTSTT